MLDDDNSEVIAVTSCFPDIKILLCRFHFSQCLRNAVNRFVSASQYSQAKQLIGMFIVCVKKIRSIKALDAAINDLAVQIGFKDVEHLKSSSPKTGPGAFVYYFIKKWRPDRIAERWMCTSYDYEHCKMARLPHTFPTTNNHVESFNNHLKRWLKHVQISNSKMRIDRFVAFLMLTFTPALLTKRHQQHILESTSTYPLRLQQQAEHLTHHGNIFFHVDEARESRARNLIDKKSVFIVSCNDQVLGSVSSESKNDVVYQVTMPADGTCDVKLTCNCEDAMIRFAFCKHLRAVWHIYKHKRSRAPDDWPTVTLLHAPSSPQIGYETINTSNNFEVLGEDSADVPFCLPNDRAHSLNFDIDGRTGEDEIYPTKIDASGIVHSEDAQRLLIDLRTHNEKSLSMSISSCKAVEEVMRRLDVETINADILVEKTKKACDLLRDAHNALESVLSESLKCFDADEPTYSPVVMNDIVLGKLEKDPHASASRRKSYAI
jgi:hypothetical protein